MSLCADSEGGVFVGTDVGFFWISPAGELKKLAAITSSAIFQDRDGRLWVNSFNALNVYSFENHRLEASE